MSTKAKKERLKQERNKNLCGIDDFCTENKLNKEFITEYHLRIKQGEEDKATIVDVFPTSKKYCVIYLKGAKKSQWGMYSRESELLKYFN